MVVVWDGSAVLRGAARFVLEWVSSCAMGSLSMVFANLGFAWDLVSFPCAVACLVSGAALGSRVVCAARRVLVFAVTGGVMSGSFGATLGGSWTLQV